MDSAAAARPSLPPIQFLDSDKLRREESEHHGQNGHSITPVSATPATFPQAPPPPYSASSSSSQSSYHNQAPPKTNGHFPEPNGNTQDGRDARDVAPQAPRRSLPSLSEALGVDRNPSNPLSITKPALLTQPPQPYDSPRRASAKLSPPHAASSFGPQAQSYPTSQQSTPRYPHAEVSDYRARDYAESQQGAYGRRSPPLATQARPPPPLADHGAHQEPPRGQAAASQFSFGYAHPPGPYASAPPPRPSLSAPSYQPAVRPPVSEPAQGWRPDPSAPSSIPPLSRIPNAYSDSVKRHLDFYDFELALNEIAEHSTTTLDFSRSYGSRLHQAQRSGVAPGSLPSITEVEDLMAKSRQTLDALGRLREVLVAQQAAYFQQAQEQHSRIDQDQRTDSMVHPDDSKVGGFAGGEPKKRRGRNAAPGRCHSCNRAETPEWRRGPDGARTLCNACGLHYAKLTRKAGANKGAVTGSSLRPKGKEEEADM